MEFTRENEGVCSTRTTVRLSPDGIIEHIDVADGCDGNLTAVCALLKGRKATEAIPLLKGITCEDSPHSCPDQIALCLQQALAQLEG